jgi:hypothetical protein
MYDAETRFQLVLLEPREIWVCKVFEPINDASCSNSQFNSHSYQERLGRRTVNFHRVYLCEGIE